MGFEAAKHDFSVQIWAFHAIFGKKSSEIYLRLSYRIRLEHDISLQRWTLNLIPCKKKWKINLHSIRMSVGI